MTTAKPEFRKVQNVGQVVKKDGSRVPAWSLFITLPKPFCQVLDIKSKDILKIRLNSKGQIVMEKDTSK